MVNFHALAWYAERHGGAALHGGDRHMALDVVALLFGSPPGGHAETRLAYADALDRFGPEDLSFLAEGIERAASQLASQSSSRSCASAAGTRSRCSASPATCANRPRKPTPPPKTASAKRSSRPTSATSPSRARTTSRS